MLLRAWRAYIQTLNRWPTATQMVQGGFLMGTGDLAAQVLVDGKKRSELEAERAVRFAAIGTFFVAPIIRVWYSALERLVTPMSLSAARATVAKVALDQLAFAPPFQASIIAVIGLAQGQKSWQIKQKLKKEWSDVVKAGWMLWPWVQLCNFFFVPLLVRPLVVSITAFFWNIYFSWKANKLRQYGGEEKKN